MKILALAFLALACTAPAFAIPPNAVLWWDFQGSGIDRSGKGNDYTLQNGAFYTGGQRRGFTARHDGTNDRTDNNNTASPALDIDHSWALFMVIATPIVLSDKGLMGKFTSGNAGYFLWVSNTSPTDGGPDIKGLHLFLTGSDVANYDRSQDLALYANKGEFSVAACYNGVQNKAGNVSMFVQGKKSKSLSGFSAGVTSLINAVCFQVGCRGGSGAPSLFAQMDTYLAVVLQGGTMAQLEAQVQWLHWTYFGGLRAATRSGIVPDGLGVQGYLS